MNDNPSEMVRMMGAVGEQIGEAMVIWRRALGLPDPSEVGYVGNRCGWYPARPKRVRKVRR